MAQAQMPIASTRKQRIENAMTTAVLQNLMKNFNKPKLYEVTITENIQPDIVGFILATKKKLFCMTLDELYSLFPQQSFLGVELNKNIGPDTVHRINPFTPDEDMAAMVNKYLSKYDMSDVKKMGKKNIAEDEEEEEEEYEEEENSCEEDSTEEQEAAVDMPKHVSFKDEELTSKNPPKACKRAYSHPGPLLPPHQPQPAKRTKGIPKKNAADVTHVKGIKAAKRRYGLADVVQQVFGTQLEPQRPPLPAQVLTPPPPPPPPGNITDIVNKAAFEAEINTNQ